jgi:hypothetical protein
MPIAQQIFLSTVETDVLCSHLEIGRLPYPLGVPSTGFRWDERARVVEQTWAGLAARGLVDGPDVDDGVAELLRLLARPAVGVDAVGDVGAPLRALAVRSGGTAAAGMLTDAGLTMVEVRPTALTATLVDLLPHAEPGPGYAFNFPHRVLAAAVAAEEGDGDEDMFFGGGEHDVLVRAGMTNGDARLLAELVEGRVRGGQFGITSWNRSRGGQRAASDGGDVVRHPRRPLSGGAGTGLGQRRAGRGESARRPR